MNVALSEYTRRELKGLLVSDSRIKTIPLFAPDLTWFDSAKKSVASFARYGLLQVKHPTVFYGATHQAHKGFEYYLLAAKEVLKKTDATFIVGGQGPLTPALRQLVRELGIENRVVFTGWISNYHMPSILHNVVDICVSTSLIEQLPSYILECMAAAKPVIASNVAGVPEVVKPGENGYLVRPRDSAETAARIVELILAPTTAREQGVRGRAIIEKGYNMESAVSKLMSIYSECVEGRKA
jgi:glycosyltransferase involved in cell wall biosynthesis